ncbi:MAG: hypothetical protein NT062_31080 [Proteobacteria bacterium]|nr:hypothetical protein [Pseudomonadota bacterium]
MKLTLPTQQPFSLAQAITFIQRFAPIKADYVVTPTSVTAAVVREGRGHWFTLRDDRPEGGPGEVTLELSPRAPASVARLAARFVGAHEDVRAFYAAAEGDPPMRALVQELHGLHHVRFLTLEEIAVYCVMMQRTPIARAAAMKRRFVAQFGRPVLTADGTLLRAMPEFDELTQLDGDAIGAAIGHGPKGRSIAKVVAGVAALGEDFLTTAPYADAREALLAIPGIGPFSAGAILLRGLGRMDELPTFTQFDEAAGRIYGPAYDARAIERRYQREIGYWAYYVKTGAARRARTVDTV